TNVIFNYCVDVQKDTAIINYLTKVRQKENLFVSALSVIQIVSIIQSRNNKKFPTEKKRSAIDNLRKMVKKITVARLEEKDVEKTLTYDDNEYDLEDVVHYCVLKKLNCNAIITNNVSDFSQFKKNINVLPAHLGIVKNEIN
ncbi:MAG: hypothetical protein IKR41_12655, partial [Bacteroidales bacterium]|nr:hypothetical protein [Bacteroidales bacterium]